MTEKPRKLPHMTKPCAECPFRKDIRKGWLGEERVAGLLNVDSFVCHKKTDKQCAGHMLISGKNSAYVRMALALDIDLKLSGKHLVFESPEACINHHKDD